MVLPITSNVKMVRVANSVKLPPSKDDSELVTITAPRSIESGLNAGDKVSKSLLSFNPENEKPERVYPRNVYKSFSLYQWFMYCVMRYPIQSRVTPDGYQFKCSLKSLPTIGFCVTSCILIFTMALVVINYFGVLLNFPPIEEPPKGAIQRNATDLHFEEQYIIRKNMVPLIIVLTNLLHAVTGSLHFFKMRNFMASYFTFWTEAAVTINIDVARGVKRYMRIILIAYGSFLFVFLAICIPPISPVSAGGPAAFAMMLTRVFHPQVHKSPMLPVLRGFAGVFFFYIMICGKTFILLFIIVCKFLVNGYKVWNARVEAKLLKTKKVAPTSLILNAQKKDWAEDPHAQDFNVMFKDHVCLLELQEGADTLFASVLETYYISQFFSIIAETYCFYWSVATNEAWTGGRKRDGLVFLLYLLHSIAILVLVSMNAAAVGEEAREGLEIMRQRGMMGALDEEELYFVHTMYSSYTGQCDSALGGSGYFTFDRGFLVFVIGTIFSYFIILIQFSPALVMTCDTDSRVPYYDMPGLMRHVEGEYFGKLLDRNNSNECKTL